MLWGGRWEGGSCLGTHVRIKDLKILKIKKKLKKKSKYVGYRGDCAVTQDPSLFQIKLSSQLYRMKQGWQRQNTRMGCTPRGWLHYDNGKKIFRIVLTF